MTGYAGRSSTSRDRSFDSFVKSILPPPPDVRRVVQRQKEDERSWSVWHRPIMQEPYMQSQVKATKPTISSLNTTLIGDYVAAAFPEHGTQWLVQAQGNATLESVLVQIKQQVVIVDRHYVFFQLGGNQIRTTDFDKIFSAVLNLVVITRERNSQSRIFFLGVLPRPIDNQEAKPYVVRFNRWMANAVDQVGKIFEKIRFLPIQLHFIQESAPKEHLFRQDQPLMINEAGARIFKEHVFLMAGFARNAV